MFTIKRKLYSRHTPNNLEKYRDLSEEDMRKMSRGQKLNYLEDEYDKVGRNEMRYVAKKGKKWGLAGSIAGAGAGYALGGGAGAVAGGIYGGFGGLAIGGIRGSIKAKKEGHDQLKISLKKAKELDRVAREMKEDDDYEAYVKRMFRDKETERNARATRDMSFVSLMRS